MNAFNLKCFQDSETSESLTAQGQAYMVGMTCQPIQDPVFFNGLTKLCCRDETQLLYNSCDLAF